MADRNVKQARIKLQSLQPGKFYAIQARSVFDNHKSEYSPKFVFQVLTDTIAPAAPSNLQITQSEFSFIVTWDAPTLNEPDPSGYQAPLSQTNDFVGYVVQVYPTGNESAMQEFYWTDTTWEFTFGENRHLFGGSGAGDITIKVYSRDYHGNRSQTPAVATISNQPPAPFDIIDARTGNLSIIVEWEVNADTDIWKYQIEVDGVRGLVVFPGETNDAGNMEATLPDPGQGLHDIRVVAIDRFGAETWSNNTMSASAGGYFDTTSPGQVAGPYLADTTPHAELGTFDAEIRWALLQFNADGTAYTDYYQYRVRWSRFTTGPWQYADVDDPRYEDEDTAATEASYTIQGLSLDTNYYVNVRALDQSGNPSRDVNDDAVWSNQLTISSTDNIAPQKPAPPTLIRGSGVSPLQLMITHNLQRSTGQPADNDIDYYEVWYKRQTNFGVGGSVADATGRVSGDVRVFRFNDTSRSAGVTYFSPQEPSETIYFRVIAVDRAGNRSTASNSSNNQIDQIESKYIASLSASKIVSGTINTGDINVQSKLVIDAFGALESSNYDPTNKTGYRLDTSGLTLYQGDIIADTITSGVLQSSNYVAGSAGWKLDLSGSLTAYNGFFQGAIQADDGYIGGNLYVRDTVVVGQSGISGRLQSYNGNWYLNADGSAYLGNAVVEGDITATSGSFYGDLDVYGTFTMQGTSSALQTGISGARIRIGWDDKMYVWDQTGSDYFTIHGTGQNNLLIEGPNSGDDNKSVAIRTSGWILRLQNPDYGTYATEAFMRWTNNGFGAALDGENLLIGGADGGAIMFEASTDRVWIVNQGNNAYSELRAGDIYSNGQLVGSGGGDHPDSDHTSFASSSHSHNYASTNHGHSEYVSVYGDTVYGSIGISSSSYWIGGSNAHWQFSNRCYSRDSSGNRQNIDGATIYYTGLSNVSSIEFKKDVTLVNYVDALDEFKQIDLYNFKWKHDNKPEVGVVAEYIPDRFVIEDPADPGMGKPMELRVDKNTLDGVHMAATRALINRVEQLESALDAAGIGR